MSLNQHEATLVLADIVSAVTALDKAAARLTDAQVRLDEWRDGTLPGPQRRRLLAALRDARAPLYAQREIAMLLIVDVTAAIGAAAAGVAA